MPGPKQDWTGSRICLESKGRKIKHERTDTVTDPEQGQELSVRSESHNFHKVGKCACCAGGSLTWLLCTGELSGCAWRNQAMHTENQCFYSWLRPLSKGHRGTSLVMLYLTKVLGGQLLSSSGGSTSYFWDVCRQFCVALRVNDLDVHRVAR